MDSQVVLKLLVEHHRQGTYFTLSFDMPEGTEQVSISYAYSRYGEDEQKVGLGTFVSHQEANIIDIGLLAPDGRQVGASGSNKLTFFVNETDATPGFHRWPLVAGRWQILVGAYKVVEVGVEVTYTITFTPKQRRLFKGDLHTHTLASDGVLMAGELAWRALRHGLDFLAITDHNQMVTQDALPKVPGLTVIPGIEWTHYQGHSNFLGLDQPFDAPFFTNTPAEVQSRFVEAHQRGAVITLNHPFEPGCEFQLDMKSLPFDCLEIWNGPMRESNLKAVGLWQSWLAAGQKVPISGGSDFHRDTPFIFPGGPTTCILSPSAGKSDLLASLKAGNAYLIFAPDGPTLSMAAGEAILGESVAWPQVNELSIEVDQLLKGDVIRVVTAKAATPIFEAPLAGRFQVTWPVPEPGFVRLEILRAFLPGLPLLPALISNPIYFDAA